ncbi:hypothetical protein [Mycobacterium sp.]|uniref:hypothetical protein n=1 Tax=Mycobacterium sp. TaxID=1785 RepID=UPI0028BF26BA|nr:hypothetical protein [Mycobacterium sp.]
MSAWPARPWTLASAPASETVRLLLQQVYRGQPIQLDGGRAGGTPGSGDLALLKKVLKSASA